MMSLGTGLALIAVEQGQQMELAGRALERQATVEQRGGRVSFFPGEFLIGEMKREEMES